MTGDDVPDVREPLAQGDALGGIDLEPEDLNGAVQLGIRIGKGEKRLKFLDQSGQ